MKTAILLTLVAAVACQYSNDRYDGQIVFPTNPQRPSGGSTRPGGPSPSGETLGQILAGRPNLNTQQCNYPSNNVVHQNVGQSDYHFSWCYDGGKKYDWSTAISYCNGLGGNWKAVSIESAQENKFITRIIALHELPYIWTSGTRQFTKDWQWSATGAALYYTNWARTGGLGQPQPDNNENNNEQCLGILNHFYPNDGITWHDIGCHHLKPVICERQRYSG